MSSETDAARRQLWLELPPMSAGPASRLLIFLHGAGSSPEAFAPVAIAWQLKFPGAVCAILQGLDPSPFDAGHDWYDARGVASERAPRISRAVEGVATRIAALQSAHRLDGGRTIIVGFSQGATMALELVRTHPAAASVVVAYAGRLATPIRSQERIGASVHLVHGTHDSLVPVVHARRALRGLLAIGTHATLDLTEDGTHAIGQDMIILGTARAMQSVFRGRSRRPRPAIRPDDAMLH